MNPETYRVSRIRTCDVLRAIEAGHTTVRAIREQMPAKRLADLRNSIQQLRKMNAIRSVRQGGAGNCAIYETKGPIEPVIEELMPRTKAPDASELERAMGLPPYVQATLAVAARGRVILGVAGLNARG